MSPDTSTAPIVTVRSSVREGVVTHTPGRQTCVFLDRDGVLNEIDKYVKTPEELDACLFPEALAAVARLSRESNVKLVLVSNQGSYNGQKEATMQRLLQRIEEAGGRLDAIYICPNNKFYVPPEGEENARKPGPGMLLQAAHDFGPQVDLADSYFVGDMTTDIAAGESAEGDLTSVLVETGFGGKDGRAVATPDHTAKDLTEAVDWIIAREHALET